MDCCLCRKASSRKASLLTSFQGDEEIDSDRMFDEFLDELEHLYTDDHIDRKRFLAALGRKHSRLSVEIAEELKGIPFEGGGTKDA